MTEFVSRENLELARWIRAGDIIVTTHGCAVPQTLLDALYAQRQLLGGVGLFIATSFWNRDIPEYADHIGFSSIGAIGSLRTLAKAGVLRIIPMHIGQIGNFLQNGRLPCDVAFVQVGPADANGTHSLSLCGDFGAKAIQQARVVIAEVNAAAPDTRMAERIPSSAFDVVVEADRRPVELMSTAPEEVDRAIALHAAQFIEDGSVLQIGIGGVPEAITRLIADRRNLGVHSGMIGDGIVDLMECGAVNNGLKKRWRGVTVTGSLIGSERLFRFAHRNPDIVLSDTSVTHDESTLVTVDNLVTINSAVEVDLTGQVNAELAGGNYIGGTGGQVDYVRGGSRSKGGVAIIALRSMTRSISKIVASLNGPVTTARAEVDMIVTEHGIARLAGKSLRERAESLLAIADPSVREDLEREAHPILKGL